MRAIPGSFERTINSLVTFYLALLFIYIKLNVVIINLSQQNYFDLITIHLDIIFINWKQVKLYFTCGAIV